MQFIIVIFVCLFCVIFLPTLFGIVATILIFVGFMEANYKKPEKEGDWSGNTY